MNNRRSFMHRSIAIILLASVAVFTGLAGSARSYGQAAGSQANVLASGGNAPTGFDMAPETRPEVVQAAVDKITDKIPAGPFTADWKSLEAGYRVPAWFNDAKFGIFMHWGVYSVPAYHNEWYKQFMYGAGLSYHTATWGPPEKFGYKDFIPMFTQAKFDPEAWATLFEKSGAKYVVPTAQHHDNFSLWDSQFNPYNAVKMGPHRDLIGDLSKAVRAHGLKFGVSNHGIEAFQFVKINAQLEARLKAANADVYDPKWADFYCVADRSDAACEKFLVNWVQRNEELIDKYQPDMLWFDNGVDMRYLDPLKLWVAAYYYNRAASWGKQVSISTKKAAYAPASDNLHTIGSIIDFEKIGSRSPAGIRPGSWQVDDPIGSTWGYTTGMSIANAGSIVGRLVNVASQNGNLLLNISPMADGTIPQAQQTTLLGVGEWLGVNGEAIYGTHNWVKFADSTQRGGTNIRFTVKGDNLYAIIVGQWPGASVTVQSLATGSVDGKVTAVTMLGDAGALTFTQGANGLTVQLPAKAPCNYAYTLKISGLKTNGPTTTPSGNPQ
jgi:alpha-L-fucosidase